MPQGNFVEIKKEIAETVTAFSSGSLFENSINLFRTLGYDTNRQNPLKDTTFNGFKSIFITGTEKFNQNNALTGDWIQIELLFQLTGQEMVQQDKEFKPTLEREQPASFLFFAIDLKGNFYSRNRLSQIAREINKCFPMDVFLLFRYENYLTLSLIERRPHKKILDKDVMEKVTHIYNIDIKKPHAAHIQILSTFALDAIRNEAPRKRLEGFKDLKAGWNKVVSTQVLNRQFYLDYQSLSKKLINSIYPTQQSSKIKAHQAILNLLNRIMFIYFVQKKRWIMGDENFLFHFWKDYLASGDQDKFHKNWLNAVFFKAFNGIAFRSPEIFRNLPEPYKLAILQFPYLNGGLFTYNEELDDYTLNDDLFHVIFNFFEGYIFTISEDTPYDINLEINPELLGRMYEGMINATDLDDVEAEHGIVYTERPEINFMVRRSFVEVLDKKLAHKQSKEFLYFLVFGSQEQKIELLRKYKIKPEEIRDAILSITVCDPACGSGSMLLGVIHVQIELLRAIDEYTGNPLTPKDEFELKKQLVSESIYGVDIKEWAVRIAELRLWLYMIADAEFSEEELTKQPLLPNLDFKLRCGNSLLQKFGSLDFSIEELLKGRDKSKGATRKLHEYIKKKKSYILNRESCDTSFKQLKNEEYQVFNQFIDELIFENEQKIKNRRAASVKQATMFATGIQSEIDIYEEEIKTLGTEIDELRKLKEFLKKDKQLPFSYDIDFMEIFLTKDDPGFDLIVGNPPYVRQEAILPPEDGEYLEYLLKPENKEEKTQVNKSYKEKLNEKVYKTYPFLKTTIRTEIEEKQKTIPIYGNKIPGRSDLYCYFQLLCPSYLNSKGTFCFIISNSWLDVDFGKFIQHFLVKHTILHAVYDCNVRSFDAAINTIIYLHSSLININGKSGDRFFKALVPPDSLVRLIMNKINYTDASYAPILIEQDHCRENTFREYYRVIPITQKQLYEVGFNEESKTYDGDKWGGKYLRAPEIYYTILEKGKDKLVRLGDIALVKRGITTGANEFFILSTEEAKEWGIEEEYLTPIVKSSREVKNLTTSQVQSFNRLFHVRKPITGKSDGARKYISHGTDQDFWEGNAPAFRMSCKDRVEWYVIGDRKIPSLACNYMIDTMMRFFYYNQDKEKALVCLNSTLFNLFLNIHGRGNFGDGLMKLQTFEVKDLITFEPNLLPTLPLSDFLIRDQTDIFTELGFDRKRTIRDQLPKPLHDRKALDDIIFDELDLTQEERNEVYWSLAELVKQRLDKAGSR
jgi:hypothetical protein